MRFKAVSLTFLFLFLWEGGSLNGGNLDHIKVHSESAILIDGKTKEVLYQKNAFKKYPPASITKVSTLLYVLKKTKENLHKSLQADYDCMGSITKEYSQKMKYNYPPHWLVLGGTHMDIHNEEILRVKDLLYGMMMVSANDAANVLAKYVGGGSVTAFMGDLNKYLKSIGCKNTLFKNPHGLNYPQHLTTAYDMSLILYEGLKDPLFKEIFSANQYHLPPTNKKESRKLATQNKLLQPSSVYYYPYAIGGKIGFHNQAKSTFVAAAEKNGRTLIVVLLQCPKSHLKYEDAIRLFKAGFEAQK